jgi:hypothetical protein
MANTEITYDLTAKIVLLPTDMGGRKNRLPAGTSLLSFLTHSSILQERYTW